MIIMGISIFPLWKSRSFDLFILLLFSILLYAITVSTRQQGTVHTESIPLSGRKKPHVSWLDYMIVALLVNIIIAWLPIMQAILMIGGTGVVLIVVLISLLKQSWQQRSPSLYSKMRIQPSHAYAHQVYKNKNQFKSVEDRKQEVLRYFDGLEDLQFDGMYFPPRLECEACSAEYAHQEELHVIHHPISQKAIGMVCIAHFDHEKLHHKWNLKNHAQAFPLLEVHHFPESIYRYRRNKLHLDFERETHQDETSIFRFNLMQKIDNYFLYCQECGENLDSVFTMRGHHCIGFLCRHCFPTRERRFLFWCIKKNCLEDDWGVDYWE